jgi:hypothetical protein
MKASSTNTPARKRGSRTRRIYKFAMYATPPPAGEWDYMLDDFQIVFGPGWWPFYDERRDDGEQGEPAVIRLSPSTEYRAWNTEYVLLGASGEASAEGYLTLYRRRRGMGALVVDVKVTIDMRARSFTIGQECPPAVRAQAEVKARRLLRFLLSARMERRRGVDRPRTMHDRWLQSQRTPHRP